MPAPSTFSTRTTTVLLLEVQIGDKWFDLGDVCVDLTGLADTDQRDCIDVRTPYLGRHLAALGVIRAGPGGYHRHLGFQAFRDTMEGLWKASMERCERQVEATRARHRAEMTRLGRDP